MTSPSVTVLMAVHNGLPYLPQAIRSVLGQTFSDLELLIVDDGSTDGTSACVRSFRDARIRLICNTECIGQTRSLNIGLREAHGQYLARLDADDVCLSERLERQVHYLEEHPEVLLVGTRMEGIDEEGRRTEFFGKPLNDFGTFIGCLVLGACPIGHPTVLGRRSAIMQLGGYDERYRIGQDYDLWIRLAMARLRVSVLPEPLVKYRMHLIQQSVVDRLAHRRELITIHERFVSQFCPAAHARQVACLLRMDEAFWAACASKEEAGAAAQALQETLVRIQQQLQLTAVESNMMNRLVVRRVGLGVKLAPTLIKYPSLIFYPFVSLLSPLLIPHCCSLLASASRCSRRCRVAVGQRVSLHHQTPDLAEWLAPPSSHAFGVGNRSS